MELKLEKIAERLSLPVSTLIRWIRQGYIPVKQQGGVGMFEEKSLANWARRHQLTFSPEKSRENAESKADQPETLLKAMTIGGVFHGICGEDVSAVLLDAVERIPDLSVADRKKLHRRLMDREALTPTGIGNGVAIPHPRTPVTDPESSAKISTCFLEAPIDYGSIDDKPVLVLFILLCPTTAVHLHLLSRLAFCVRDDAFVRFLHTRPAPELFLNKIAEFEAKLDGASR